MKNKYAQSIADVFSQFVKSSKRKPNLLDLYDGKEYVDEFFTEFLNSHNVRRYSRNAALGAVIAERVNRSFRKLSKKPNFLKRNADCYLNFNQLLKSIKIPVIIQRKWNQLMLLWKKMKKKSIQIFTTREKEPSPMFKLDQLVRTADNNRVFSKSDSTNYSYILYTITEVIHDTIPSSRLNYLPERYNQNLLLTAKLTLEENNQVMKKLNLIQ